MNKKHRGHRDEPSYDEQLKGTFVSVLLIGLFILLSWFGIFSFYWSTLG
ncbi:MAG: cytochrome c oxidase subunit 2A [Bacilli bacterium]|nr:cytochrome c oxidase subunit 2A [Bacilli bacterium]